MLRKNNNQRYKDINSGGLRDIVMGCVNAVTAYKQDDNDKSTVCNKIYENISAIIAHPMIDPKVAADNIFTHFNDSKNTRNSALRTVVDSAKTSVETYVKESKDDFSFETVKNQYDDDDIDDISVERKRVSTYVRTVLAGANDINWLKISTKTNVNADARKNDSKQKIKPGKACESIVARMAIMHALQNGVEYLNPDLA